jgi:hypothetical protein
MLVSRPFLLLAAAASLAGSGCTTFRTVPRPTTLGEAEELVAATGHRQVEVEYALERGVARGRGTLASADAGSFLLHAPPQPDYRIPFQATRRISFKDHGKGAVDGLVVGAIGGAIAGFVVGAGLGGSCMSSETPCAHSYKWASIGAIGAVSGALVMGGIAAGIGASFGHRTTLTF